MTFPWGKRRNTNGQADTTDSLVGLTTDRGYTEHEHLDEMGLIHMNGRVYDPLVGRMMSADPFIQAPGSLQSYNRYAYVMNNPLNLTDPSGYFSLRGFFKNPFKAFNSHGDRVGGAILGAPFGSRGYHAVFNFLQGSGGYQLKSAVLTAASGFCYAWAAACNAGAQAGLTRAYGGSDDDALRAGAIAGVSTGAFQLAGSVGGGSYVAHAAAGCVSAAAGGGNCGQGAVAAVFGKYTSISLRGFGGSGIQGVIARGVATIVAGGVGSVIGGGKFENGALTAAYGFLFNECGNTRSCGSDSTKVTVSGNRVLGNMAHSEIQISSGYDFVVLEGQPGYSNGNNLLEGRSNGANQGDAFSIELSLLDGRTMAQFAADLQTAGASYRNNLTYSFPSIRYGFSNLNGGYNSNSYVGGVLDAAAPGAGFRYVVQGAASRGGFRVPGMENPIPLSPVR